MEKNKLAELIEERTKQLDEIWRTYESVEEEYNQKMADILPYKDKYIKIVKDNDFQKYCKVTDISADRQKIYIYGLWFFGDISEYTKENFFTYKYDLCSYYIRDLNSWVNSIKIITKDEFIEEYKKLSNDLLVNLNQMEN
jgi:hypothetical protein